MKKMYAIAAVLATSHLEALDISTIEARYQDLHAKCMAQHAHIDKLTGLQKACLPVRSSETMAEFARLSRRITELYTFLVDMQHDMLLVNKEYMRLLEEPTALVLSRFPREPEVPSVRSFIELAASVGVRIDTVRFIDSCSLISAMPLENETKHKFLSLLNAKFETVLPEISEFLNEWQFEDPVLRNTVLRFAYEGSESSSTFRNLLITMAAAGSLKRISFRRSVDYGIVGSMIEMGLNGPVIPGIALFPGEGTQYKCKDGSYSCCWPGHVSLFHEGGHILSGAAVRDAKIADQCALISEITEMKIDQAYCDMELANLAALPPSDQQDFVDMMNLNCKTSFGCLNDFVNFVQHLHTQRGGAALAAYHTAGEVLQILGIACMEVQGNNVLLVNLLSDFALNLESGLPLRHGHWAASGTGDSAVNLQGINCGLLNALFGLHGRSLDAYVSRLLFGNHLLAYHARELSLAKFCEAPARSWDDFYSDLKKPMLSLTWDGSLDDNADKASAHH